MDLIASGVTSLLNEMTAHKICLKKLLECRVEVFGKRLPVRSLMTASLLCACYADSWLAKESSISSIMHSTTATGCEMDLLMSVELLQTVSGLSLTAWILQILSDLMKLPKTNGVAKV